MTAGGSRAVLLDTCTLLDLNTASDKIAPDLANSLADLRTQLFVSAASAWEIAIKTHHGKLPGGEHLLASWDDSLVDLQADRLEIDHADAIRAGGLSWVHRDPFDRMLVGQASRHNLPLATRDEVIIEAEVVNTIDTRHDQT